MLRDYTGIKPDLYKRYMDDVAGAASCTEDDLSRFLTFASSYHPKLEHTWSISSAKLPFLDMFLIPRDDRVAASIHYKETYSHSYLNVKSSHPFKCKASIPTSHFLRLRKICSEDDDFKQAATTMESRCRDVAMSREWEDKHTCHTSSLHCFLLNSQVFLRYAWLSHPTCTGGKTQSSLDTKSSSIGWKERKPDRD